MKKYRIVKSADQYYIQQKVWWWWEYVDNLNEVSMHFNTLEEAQEWCKKYSQPDIIYDFN